MISWSWGSELGILGVGVVRGVIGGIVIVCFYRGRLFGSRYRFILFSLSLGYR